MVAAIKTGYKALFVSPRNPREAQLNLFELSHCRLVARPKSHAPVVQSWLEHRDMETIDIDDLDTILSKPEVPRIQYTKTVQEAEWDPFVVLHTSGSTGLPKPIVIKHGSMTLNDIQYHLPPFEGYLTMPQGLAKQSKRHFSPMPFFHAGGIYGFIGPMFLGRTPVALGYSDRPLTPELTLECIKYSGSQSAGLAPSLLDEMCQRPEQIAELKKLASVGFGGGPLNKETGDKLASHGIPLIHVIGSTETLPICLYYQPDPYLWQYFIYNDEYSGIEWRKITPEDDTYEMVITRKPAQHSMQGVFYNFPDLQEWRTNDLYEPHPTLPHHWRFNGRADNIITLSNGEKFSPDKMEEIIGCHPEVRTALIVGTQRFQPALIIEPFTYPETDEQVDDLIDRVIPSVAEANETVATHGRIVRHLTMVAVPGKPFAIADKGSHARSATAKLYADEIEELYKNPRELRLGKVQRLVLESEAELALNVMRILREQLGIPGIQLDTSFFQAGIDSLQFITIARLMTASLRAAGNEDYDQFTIETRDIYAHASCAKLANHIFRLFVQGHGFDGISKPGGVTDTEAMKSLYEGNTRDLIRATPGRPEPSGNQQTVILTGSTGNIGSYLLDELVRNPKVKKVICLNRSDDGGAAKQETSMRERGLQPGSQSGKVEYICVALDQTHLGLPQEVYTRLLEDVDHVIHNAWAVNFNMPIDGFVPHIKGVRHLADFAARAKRRVVMIFVSSIASVSRWGQHRGPIPERSIKDFEVAGNLGYGQSKLVGSLILEDAAVAGDFPFAIVRTGQVAGPMGEKGAWTRSEWIPSIIASSLQLKALPKDLGRQNQVAWIPIEIMSRAILEIGGLTEESTGYHEGYFNAINPNPTTIEPLLRAVQGFYGADSLLELISLREWVRRLEEKSRSADVLGANSSNSGLRLLEYYEGLELSADPSFMAASFDTQRTISCSPSLRSVGCITPEMMAHWCGQWDF